MHKFPPFCLIPFQPCCFLPLWTIHLFFPHPHLCPVPPPNSFFPNPLPPLFISFNFAFLSSWGRRYAFSLSLYLCPLISLTLWMSFFYLSLSLCLSLSLSVSFYLCAFKIHCSCGVLLKTMWLLFLSYFCYLHYLFLSSLHLSKLFFFTLRGGKRLSVRFSVWARERERERERSREQ